MFGRSGDRSGFGAGGPTEQWIHPSELATGYADSAAHQSSFSEQYLNESQTGPGGGAYGLVSREEFRVRMLGFVVVSVVVMLVVALLAPTWGQRLGILVLVDGLIAVVATVLWARQYPAQARVRAGQLRARLANRS